VILETVVLDLSVVGTKHAGIIGTVIYVETGLVLKILMLSLR
jgi:hypothetical protein